MMQQVKDFLKLYSRGSTVNYKEQYMHVEWYSYISEWYAIY